MPAPSSWANHARNGSSPSTGMRSQTPGRRPARDSAPASSPGFVRDGPLGGAIACGALGVLAFSFTLPATRLAVHDLDGTVVGLGRALVAALLAAAVLGVRVPSARQVARLAVVAAGVVVGFPLCTSLALGQLPASHGAVIVGLVPAATAAMAVLRAGERPSASFWLAVAAGVVTVLAFALSQGAGGLETGDLLILLAVALAALG